MRNKSPRHRERKYTKREAFAAELKSRGVFPEIARSAACLTPNTRAEGDKMDRFTDALAHMTANMPTPPTAFSTSRDVLNAVLPLLEPGDNTYIKGLFVGYLVGYLHGCYCVCTELFALACGNDFASGYANGYTQGYSYGNTYDRYRPAYRSRRDACTTIVKEEHI